MADPYRTAPPPEPPDPCIGFGEALREDPSQEPEPEESMQFLRVAMVTRDGFCDCDTCEMMARGWL